MEQTSSMENCYEMARDRYTSIGVNTETVIERMKDISLSIQCWQGDDVIGFESTENMLDGGIQVTGQYPGRARTVGELRQDLSKALSLIPGSHRLNLHAMYGEFDKESVDRDQIKPDHFQGWIDWAKGKKLGLDFNATCFSHPNAASGHTLSHRDSGIRQFWIEHVKNCRHIAAFMGRELKTPCIHNIWIPDGSKDMVIDRGSYRNRLCQSLDEIFLKDYSPLELKDSLESKLFGIGSESFVVGSHEFYLGYAISRNKMVCLDMGHFHPTESVADKISSILQFSKELVLHISRGIRWDSDHIVILNDDLKDLTVELVRNDNLSKVHIAMDFFDASLNRVGAWVIGARATLKALMLALLEPQKKLLDYENQIDFFSRLALLETSKMFPAGAVWDRYCKLMEVPYEENVIMEIQQYDKEITRKRDIT